MSKDFETYIELLAKNLHDAADMKAWDIPIAHRTKDSISAYRASVGIVGAVMLKTLARYKNPEPTTPPDNTPVAATVPVEPVVEVIEPVELDSPQNLFTDAPAEPRRRRRNTGDTPDAA